MRYRLAQHDWRGTGGLKTQHFRQPRQHPGGLISLVPAPVGGYVARVAHRHGLIGGTITQYINYLKSTGCLPFNPVGVDGVDNFHRKGSDEIANNLQRLIEIALNRDHLGSTRRDMRQLPQGNLSLRQEHNAAQTGPGSIGGSGSSRVSRRGAYYRPGALFHGLRYCQGHTAILERTGGVAPLDLEINLSANLLRQRGRREQRRVSLPQGNNRCRVGYGMKFPVLLKKGNSYFHCSSSGGILIMSRFFHVSLANSWSQNNCT
ncbi:hypothetical protein ES703_56884 [subsurface metagenome]